MLGAQLRYFGSMRGTGLTAHLAIYSCEQPDEGPRTQAFRLTTTLEGYFFSHGYGDLARPSGKTARAREPAHLCPHRGGAYGGRLPLLAGHSAGRCMAAL